jgi:hypothetical protein
MKRGEGSEESELLYARRLGFPLLWPPLRDHIYVIAHLLAVFAKTGFVRGKLRGTIAASLGMAT